MPGQNPLHSAFRVEEWYPVHDALLQGLVHACNNRVAALAGLVQLHEADLATPQEGMAQLGAEVEQLRVLMGQFRALAGTRSARRDPARIGEALQQAVALLGYHLEARQAQFEVAEEVGHVEPVLLCYGDAVRFAVVAFLAARGATERGTVRAAVVRVGDETVVTLSGQGDIGEVQESRAYRALAAAAERERGAARIAATSSGAFEMTLALPGLSKAAARP
jgi:hypothetical protein